MKVNELVDNREFTFNVTFRIVKYAPTPYDPDYVNVLYDVRSTKEIPWELMFLDISAINETNGVLDIEVY